MDNPESNYSRLQTLTVEEYRQRQITHALALATSTTSVTPVTSRS